MHVISLRGCLYCFYFIISFISFFYYVLGKKNRHGIHFYESLSWSHDKVCAFGPFLKKGLSNTMYALLLLATC